MGEVFFWVINLTGSGVGAFFWYQLKYFLISCINLTGSSAVEWCRGFLLILLNAFSIVLFVSHLRRQKYECLMGRSVTPSGLRRRVKLCLCVYACVFVFMCVCVFVCLCLCEGCAVSGVVFVCTSKKGMEKGTLGAGIHRLSLIMFWSKGSSQFLHKSIYYR